jgi:hypothetical protein
MEADWGLDIPVDPIINDALIYIREHRAMFLRAHWTVLRDMFALNFQLVPEKVKEVAQD